MTLYHRTTMANLRPTDVLAYLRATGWQHESDIEHGSIWNLNRSHDDFEVVIPGDPLLRDYTKRMSEVLQTLAIAEARPAEQVYSDLLTSHADVVRIRIDDPEAQDGTLSMEDHAQIAQKTRDLMLAAACAALEKRAIWPTNKPAQAIDQVRKLRVGQTERGSYVVTVISRVSPTLATDAPCNNKPELPFERQVTQTLAKALAALDAAVNAAATSGKFESFESAVADGVSANLCEAVSGLWSDDNHQGGLEFRFSWSAARPIETEVRKHVRFSADRIPLIREAAKLMQERSPIKDFELEGVVVKLDRPPGQETGRVTVLGLVDGRPKRVTLSLGDPFYHWALDAHDRERTLHCVGTLVREGRGYQLQNAHLLAPEHD